MDLELPRCYSIAVYKSTLTCIFYNALFWEQSLSVCSFCVTVVICDCYLQLLLERINNVHLLILIEVADMDCYCLQQIAFTLVFWLTLRQFTPDCARDHRGSQLDAESESLETLNEGDGKFCYCELESDTVK